MHYDTTAYGGSRCTDPRYLDLGTSSRAVVSFTPLTRGADNSPPTGATELDKETKTFKQPG
jgi:hypothetical protein